MIKTEIAVQDGNKYFYTTTFFDVQNPLGVVKATLLEYGIYNSDISDKEIFKLYRTKEGYWYDKNEDFDNHSYLKTMIKIAIDECESTKLPSLQS